MTIQELAQIADRYLIDYDHSDEGEEGYVPDGELVDKGKILADAVMAFARENNVKLWRTIQ